MAFSASASGNAWVWKSMIRVIAPFLKNVVLTIITQSQTEKKCFFVNKPKIVKKAYKLTYNFQNKVQIAYCKNVNYGL